MTRGHVASITVKPADARDVLMSGGTPWALMRIDSCSLLRN